MSSWVCPTTKKPTVTSLKIRLAVSNEQNALTNLFLLSFAELSSWRNNFLGSGTAGLPESEGGVGSRFALGIEDMHLDFPCMRASKNEFCGGAENNTFDSFTGGLSSAHRMRHIDEIVKFESPGQKAVA
jgi:hypothetical protein